MRCLPLTVDLQDDAQVHGVVQEVVSGLGRLDILINNAGVAHVAKPEDEKRENWDAALRINLTVPFLLAQHAARTMIAQGDGGRVINVSSITGVGANPIWSTVGYSASKGGVEMMSRQMAVEWARHGITVNAIAPGWFATELNYDPRFDGIKPETRERMELLTPQHTLGAPGDLTSAAIFLASPGASFVTGATLHVDGGWTAY